MIGAMWDQFAGAMGDIVGRESNRDILLNIRARLVTQGRIVDDIRAEQEHIIRHLHEHGGIIVATQEQVDALTGQVTEFASSLGTIFDNIQNDLDTLKAQNPSVDLSALETSVGALQPLAARAQELADETPEAPVDGPVDGGETARRSW